MADSPTAPQHDFRLGDVVVRPMANEIEHPDGIETVGTKAMDVLVALAAHGVDVVSKEELLDAVWTGLFVGDEVLTTAIWELRRALGDDARSPRFIRTVPRRGYRLVMAPELVNVLATPDTWEPDRTPPAPTVSFARRWWAVAAVAAAVLGLAVALVAVRWLWPAPVTPNIRSMVVLPFATPGGDQRDEALADGLTDTLITSLAQIDGLRVVSATTSQTYRGRVLAAPEVGAELGVDVVVEGSVRREGDRIVLNAQLIHARTDTHLWAETYERRLEHLLDLQVEIARSIGAAIGRVVDPEPAAAVPAQVSGTEETALRWRFRTGGEIWAAPAIDRDLVVVGSRDGAVYAVDLTTGAEVWRAVIGEEVIASPAVRDGRVFAAARQGWVVALDVETGAEVWRHRMGTTVEAPLATTAGVVHVSDESGQVVALDGSSGRVLWSWQDGEGVTGITVGDGMVVASGFDGVVTALDAVDGRRLWSIPVAPWLRLSTTVAAGRVLVPTGDHHVAALDLTDGRELWRTRVPSPSEISVWRDRVLVGGEGGAIRALELDGGTELWSYETLGATTRPVVADGRVVAGSRDHTLSLLDPWSGALLGRVELATWVTTPAAFTRDRVVIGSLDGSVYCFTLPRDDHPAPFVARQADGFRVEPWSGVGSAATWDLVLDDLERPRPRLAWRTDLGAPSLSAPAVADDLVLAAAGRHLVALATDDGRERWRHRCSGEAIGPPAVAGELVFVGDRSGFVTALDLETGGEAWRFATGADVVGAPGLADGLVLFGSRDRYLYAVDVETGRERWRRELGVIHSSPATAEGVVWVPARGDRLWALDLERGRPLWSAATPDWAVADPVVWRDRVLVASCNGEMTAFAAADGRPIWSFLTGGETWYRPAVADGVVYFGSADFHLYAVGTDSGRERWRRRTGNRVLSSVDLWRDLVIVGSHDRQLWAVHRGTGDPAWRLRTTGIVGSPTVDDDSVVVGTSDGWLALLGLAPVGG